MYESAIITAKQHQLEDGVLTGEFFKYDFSAQEIVTKKTSQTQAKLVDNHLTEVKTKDADFMLVEAVKRGEKHAFDMLVIKYQTRIARLVSIYFADFESVNDVVQESFIRAYQSIGKFRGDSSFYTWLYRIAKNTALNELKKAYRTRELSGLENDENNIDFLEDNAGVRLDSAYARNEMAKIIDNALDSLPPKLRIAIVLREKKGLTYDEIAEVLECEKGTVKSRIFRAREILARKLEKFL